MSIDRSLKTAGNLSRHRNVLTRDERIARLAAGGKFDEKGDDPLGLPKVGNRKVVAAGKTKKKKTEEEGDEAAAAE
jgi:small basic protein (TIGR04137 family)